MVKMHNQEVISNQDRTTYYAEVKRLKELRNPPQQIPTPGGDTTNVKNVIISMMRMISFIMIDEVSDNEVTELEKCVKIYLAMTDIFDYNLKSNKQSDPCWITKSNYMSLLNLPEQMKLFGPLIEFWEGGIRGEGIIQELKHLIRDGLKKNWQKNILKKAYNLQSYDQLINVEPNHKPYQQKMRMFFTYNAFTDIVTSINNKEAMSIIILNDLKYIIAVKVKEKKKTNYVEIIKNEFVCHVMHQAYYKWTLNEDESITIEQDKIRTYGILLPYYYIMNKEVRYPDGAIYTYVSYDWKESNLNGDHVHPLQLSTNDL